MVSAWIASQILGIAWIAVRSRRNGSLSFGGTVAAVIVGVIHAFHPFNLLFLLLAFFLTGTQLTKYRHDLKQELVTDEQTVETQIDTAAAKAGNRTALQVLANSLSAAVLCSLHLRSKNLTPLALSPTSVHLMLIAIIAQYACACADTFSSELGILSEGWPLMITTLKKVPPGTNGGVSLLGTIAALFGGAIIGLTAIIVIPMYSWKTKVAVMVLAIWSGLLGSLIDSILGASLQRTVYNESMRKVIEKHGGTKLDKTYGQGYIIIGHDVLDNNQVNFVSGVLTMVCIVTITFAATSLYAMVF